MPPSRRLGWQFAIVLALALAAQLNMQATFAQVNHPVALGLANLEADVAVVRGWYAQLMDQGTYLQFVRTELVDMVWAVGLAAALVTLYRLVGGLLRDVHPPIGRGLFRWAPLASAGGLFDVVENIFSLAMLTDPFGFPAWWATAHVVASWCKIVASVASAVIGPTLIVVALVLARRARASTHEGEPRRRVADAGEALPPR